MCWGQLERIVSGGCCDETPPNSEVEAEAQAGCGHVGPRTVLYLPASVESQEVCGSGRGGGRSVWGRGGMLAAAMARLAPSAVVVSLAGSLVCWLTSIVIRVSWLAAGW